MQLSTVNGTEMGAQEWTDSLFLRYGLDPPDLPHYCEGCNTNFSICHALDCKRGRLITARNNELRERVADLAGKSFTPFHRRDDPLIFAGCAMKRPKSNPTRIKGTIVPENTPLLDSTD